MGTWYTPRITTVQSPSTPAEDYPLSGKGFYLARNREGQNYYNFPITETLPEDTRNRLGLCTWGFHASPDPFSAFHFAQYFQPSYSTLICRAEFGSGSLLSDMKEHMLQSKMCSMKRTLHWCVNTFYPCVRFISWAYDTMIEKTNWDLCNLRLSRDPKEIMEVLKWFQTALHDLADRKYENKFSFVPYGQILQRVYEHTTDPLEHIEFWRTRSALLSSGVLPDVCYYLDTTLYSLTPITMQGAVSRTANALIFSYNVRREQCVEIMEKFLEEEHEDFS